VASKRVLLIDDQPAQVEKLKGYFSHFRHACEYEIVTASSGPEIAAALRQGPPDLLLLDPQLTNVSGLALLQQVRRFDASLPVIVVTGKQPGRVADEVLKAGVFAYVTKPCGYGSGSCSRRSSKALLRRFDVGALVDRGREHGLTRGLDGGHPPALGYRQCRGGWPAPPP
jgi:CheY-like chemotaxis protein